MPDQSGNAVGWGALAPINGGLAQGEGRRGGARSNTGPRRAALATAPTEQAPWHG